MNNFAIPDSIENMQSPVLPDSTAKLSRADSIKFVAKQDSIRRIDSLSADSTARLKYFRAYRDDYHVVPFRQKKPSAFFLQPSASYMSRTVQLDSTGQKVIIKELIAGQKARVILELSLEEYIELRLQAINRDVWEKAGYDYKLKDTKRDLGQLITDITNIEIPLPSSGFFSIFGPPKINLRISGAVDIHGAWRNETTTGITTSALGNSRNEPDFKQQVQINLSGTIGDKLNLSADWNTERQFQYENQLKLKYTGYEDEIIQSIEAGNVSLQTSPLVGGSEALFGVKALFKMGPFSLTALASQKKSEVQEISLSGGSKSQTYEIHAYDYSPNHYFLHEQYADRNLNIFNNYYGNPVPVVRDSMRVKDIEVWKTYIGISNPNERKGNAYIDLRSRRRDQKYNDLREPGNQESIPGVQLIDTRWILLQPGIDYTLHPETGYISFITQVQDQDAIAVAFRREGPTASETDDIYFGEFLKDIPADPTARIVLRMVKPPNLQPQFKKAWNLQLRNIYPVGGRQVKEEGFTLDIKFRQEGKEPQSDYNGTKLLQAFNLDKTDKSGTSAQPDGAFDFFPNRTIFPNTGEIIFPVLQPFGQDFPASLPPELKYQSVYDTTVTFAKQDRSQDKFILAGDYSASISSTYGIGFNVVENSVKVLLNGNQLKEGIDYTVDYNIGQIIIRNADALIPGADLRITYEQNDLFQLASKTLLGLRGEYTINKQTSLGFSFLNLNQQTLSDKVRIGEEPLNNSIFGADFKTTVDLPFITKGLDNLISTSAPSRLTLNAEYAYIDPDPNTKKSTIASDNNRSIAYVDDFEGAKKIIPLGLPYGSWKDISVPNNLPFIGSLSEREQINYKAKAYWFNRTPSDVRIQDIYGDRKRAAPDAQTVQALDFVYLPGERGYYNRTPSLSEKNKNWSGIMKVLSSTANNLVEENIEFIEFWLYMVQSPKNLKLNIDLGQISEDVIPNGILDTEDKNSNDLVDEGEDTGLDGVKDINEPDYNSQTNPDPNNDNYSFTFAGDKTDYSKVNGTEGNAVSIDIGKLPDSEDLNRNFTLDRLNSYFRYEVPIDTNRVVNKFIQGGGDNAGWYLFRIPLKDYIQKIGNPSFSVIEYIRFWVSGVEQNVHLRFAEMNLVGNQWQKVLVPNEVTLDDEVLTVSTINVEDNPEYYSPPGVFRERDRSQPDYEIFKNEQSLNLILKNLPDGKKREVVRYLYRPLDVFNYKEMKLFLHGDMNDSPGQVSNYVSETDYGSEVYLRFGSDSLNYYEYRQPVKAGWNEVSMVFSDLTAIKQLRDSSQVTKIFSRAIEGQAGHSQGVLGNPTLTRITFFTIGIINPSNKGSIGRAVSGSVWINELRVLEADATPGWAYSANGSLAIADLMNISANISQTNPYFHKLNDRFGGREDRLNWGVAVDFDLLKLIPANLSGSNFRISYSRTEQSSNPLFVPGTDIKISEAQSQMRTRLTEEKRDPTEIDDAVQSLMTDAQSVSVSESWNLSNIRIKIPTDLWYIRDTFNSLTFGFNYNKTFGRSPTVLNQSNWVWNASATYALNTSRDLFFKPLDIPLVGDVVDIFTDYKDVRVYYFPQSINAGITASRRKSFTLNRTLLTKPDIQRDFTTSRNAGFNWTITENGLWNLSLSYNFDVQSTLADLLLENDIERTESQIWREIFGGVLFGKDYNYKQTFDLRSNPRLPSIWDLNRYITFNASYSASYQWQNNFQQKELGKSAGYTNRITTSLSIRLKSIFAPLFEETQPAIQTPQPQAPSGRAGGRRSQRGEARQLDRPVADSINVLRDDTLLLGDSTQIAMEQDSVVVDQGPNTLQVSFEYLKLGVKWLLLDYDQISINFSQSSSYAGGGLAGDGTGFNNFWGWNQSNSKGPSRLFMLGLSNDPGLRAPKGNLSDNYSHKNDIDLKTSRPLWQGAQLDLNWKVGWGINKTIAFKTDGIGTAFDAIPTSTGTIDRSFLSLPPTFFLSFLGNGIQKVHELYDKNADDPNANLSDAFVKGFESFSFLGKIPILSKFFEYIPRPNWNFNWSGLEQYSIFSFAKRVTLQHAYISNYSEGFKINTDGDTEIQQQRVDYAFAPLVGLNLQFDNFFSGSFTGNIRFNTKTGYSLGVSTRNITESFSRDISLSASYTKSGFELPLFGISLKNDLEISFNYTSGKTSSVIFEMDNWRDEGKPLEGKTNTTIEPKIKYVMSSRVTLSIFYRRTSIEPEGASRIPPTTTNEAGIDVHISIQ